VEKRAERGWKKGRHTWRKVEEQVVTGALAFWLWHTPPPVEEELRVTTQLDVYCESIITLGFGSGKDGTKHERVRGGDKVRDDEVDDRV